MYSTLLQFKNAIRFRNHLTDLYTINTLLLKHLFLVLTIPIIDSFWANFRGRFKRNLKKLCAITMQKVSHWYEYALILEIIIDMERLESIIGAWIVDITY